MASTVSRLSTLQNLAKRAPAAYAEEVALQWSHYEAELALLRLSPGGPADDFIALVGFLAALAPQYRALLGGLPAQLMELLDGTAAALSPVARRGVVAALVRLRNRGLVAQQPLAALFLRLLRLRDATLRDMLRGAIVADVRTANAGGRRDEGANRAVQGLLYTALRDASAPAAHRALLILTELYRRAVWRDARSVNAIASALLSPHTKLLVAALNFFLGADVGDGGGGGGDDDDDDDGDDGGSSSDGGAAAGTVGLDAKKLRAALATHAHSKHTKKRQRQTERMLAGLKKNQRKAVAKGGPVFPAIQVIHDPQGLAEKLFARLRGGGERFEVRLMMMNLISRLVGQHKLLLLPFYSFVQRYLRAHQARVTQVLTYLVQACHDLVPPDEVLPVLRAIVANFVNEGCTPEVMQVGLNAVREVCAHCPVVLEEPGMADLVAQDLVQYKNYGNRGVAASARALLNLIRDIYPALLRKRDRGRELATGGEAAYSRPTAYGQRIFATG